MIELGLILIFEIILSIDNEKCNKLLNVLVLLINKINQNERNTIINK